MKLLLQNLWKHLYQAIVYNAYVSSAQAFIDGECTMCGSNPEACCLDDESNADTCCDEMDQTGVDAISEMCGG